MKRRIAYIAWLTALLALLMSVTTLAQQSQTAGDNVVYGVITYFVDAGTLNENGDGTYSMQLVGTDNAAPYWLIRPMFVPLPPELIGTTPANDLNSVGTLLISSMINAWKLDDGLEAEAWLATRAAAVHMILSEPDYIPGDNVMTFTVDVLEVIGGEESKGMIVAPDTFRDAVLSITLDDALLYGLDIGMANAIEAVRWRCSGSDRQLAVCECKRDVDRDFTSRVERVEGYRQCNLVGADADKR